MKTEQQEEVVCPRCNQASTVCRKLLTSPFAFEQPEGASEHIGILVRRESPNPNGPIAAGFFINGYFCNDCSIGFVTRELLQEVGIDESEILNACVFVPWQGVWYAK